MSETTPPGRSWVRAPSRPAGLPVGPVHPPRPDEADDDGTQRWWPVWCSAFSRPGGLASGNCSCTSAGGCFQADQDARRAAVVSPAAPPETAGEWHEFDCGPPYGDKPHWHPAPPETSQEDPFACRVCRMSADDCWALEDGPEGNCCSGCGHFPAPVPAEETTMNDGNDYDPEVDRLVRMAKVEHSPCDGAMLREPEFCRCGWRRHPGWPSHTEHRARVITQRLAAAVPSPAAPTGAWLMVDPDRCAFDLSREPVLERSDRTTWVWVEDGSRWVLPAAPAAPTDPSEFPCAICRGMTEHWKGCLSLLPDLDGDLNAIQSPAPVSDTERTEQ